jgi:endonuclease/exonuclease/phosphatase family metal-dependent hydrolase
VQLQCWEAAAEVHMRVRVATLNVWGLPEPFSHRPSQRLDAIANRLSSLPVDAIAFQEVWTPHARRVLHEAGSDAGFAHIWYNDASIGGSGLLVASRLPIEGARFERYALRGLPQRVMQGDYFGGKGFVRLRLSTPSGPISLIDTHLQARYTADVPHEYLAHRTGQVVQLALNARRIDDPLVILGDFNFREGQPEHRILLGLTGLRDVAAELDHRTPTIARSNPYRSHSSKPDRRVDFVFARDAHDRRLVARSVEGVFDETFLLDGEPSSYSNHAGVLADLEIARGGSVEEPRAERASAIDLAREVLREGRNEAEARRRSGRAWAGAGLGCASLAALGERKMARVGRRGLLRTGLQAGALLALTPTVGFSILSELFVPSEIEAYDALLRHLEAQDIDA